MTQKIHYSVMRFTRANSVDGRLVSLPVSQLDDTLSEVVDLLAIVPRLDIVHVREDLVERDPAVHRALDLLGSGVTVPKLVEELVERLDRALPVPIVHGDADRRRMIVGHAASQDTHPGKPTVRHTHARTLSAPRLSGDPSRPRPTRRPPLGRPPRLRRRNRLMAGGAAVSVFQSGRFAPVCKRRAPICKARADRRARTRADRPTPPGWVLTYVAGLGVLSQRVAIDSQAAIPGVQKGREPLARLASPELQARGGVELQGGVPA